MDLTAIQIANRWQEDCAFSQPFDIHKENAKTMTLHSKYIIFYVKTKTNYREISEKYDKLKKLKRAYYLGQLHGHTLKKLGWEQFDLSITKTEIPNFLDADDDIILMKRALIDTETGIKILEEILKIIKDRGFAIKISFENEKYLNGA